MHRKEKQCRQRKMEFMHDEGPKCVHDHSPREVEHLLQVVCGG